MAMKSSLKATIISLSLCALYACSGTDMTYPVITSIGVPNPIDCQVYKRGESIKFSYVFTDDTELGSFNIEIHNNFDHHTHGTSSAECEMEAKKNPVNPWVYNQDFVIPQGTTTYDADFEINIPADADAGDYHFMIRLTDRAGWQQIKAMGIKISE